MSEPRARPGRLSAAALFAAALLALTLPSPPAAAQVGAGLTGADGEPIVIEAEDGIEWRQEQQIYVARGNATAVQGETTVAAQILTAHYREADGNTDIWQVVAEGGVTITSGERVITGDHAVYNVEAGVFTMTGDQVKLETPNETVTATNKLEYRSQERIAEVVGNAVATQDDKTVRADTFVAAFAEEGDEGGLTLRQVDALGNVVITTATEIARADQGVYNAQTGIATLNGNVKLTRGGNQLNGEYAEVDLNAGVSRLLGSQEGGRVHGLFIPRELEEGQQDGSVLDGAGEN